MKPGFESAGADGSLRFAVLSADSDGAFIEQMYALAPSVRAGAFVIGRGPVSPALVRDAQHALRTEGAALLWLAQSGPHAYVLGLPDGLADEQLESAFAAVESAFPELLDPRLSVTVAPLPQVLALSASGR